MRPDEERYVGLKRTAKDERVTGIAKSWKSADYLNE